jgi:hypothetical protein
VVWKAVVAFVAVLGGLQVLSGWSPTVEAIRLAVYAEPLAMPLLFVGFYAVVLLHECFIRTQREAIEKQRSSPMEQRRKSIKEARKQRLRNQRAR